MVFRNEMLKSVITVNMCTICIWLMDVRILGSWKTLNIILLNQNPSSVTLFGRGIHISSTVSALVLCGHKRENTHNLVDRLSAKL